mmetsp:Transcript_35519/g.82439  ORF Transcript_35519/g.82439 Transcript_35519/m.82439 type:complete len:208 (+) Transcript_35519:3713-4336(+)
MAKRESLIKTEAKLTKDLEWLEEQLLVEKGIKKRSNNTSLFPPAVAVPDAYSFSLVAQEIEKGSGTSSASFETTVSTSLTGETEVTTIATPPVTLPPRASSPSPANNSSAQQTQYQISRKAKSSNYGLKVWQIKKRLDRIQEESLLVLSQLRSQVLEATTVQKGLCKKLREAAEMSERVDSDDYSDNDGEVNNVGKYFATEDGSEKC